MWGYCGVGFLRLADAHFLKPDMSRQSDLDEWHWRYASN